VVAAAAVAAVPLGVLVDAAVDSGGARVRRLTNTVAAQSTRAYVARPTNTSEPSPPVVLLLHQFYGLQARVRTPPTSRPCVGDTSQHSTKPHRQERHLGFGVLALCCVACREAGAYKYTTRRAAGLAFNPAGPSHTDPLTVFLGVDPAGGGDVR
jgi:hypothetical protein